MSCTAANNAGSTRRKFITEVTNLSAGFWLASHSSQILAAAEAAQTSLDTGTDWKTLSQAEALNLAALADQVFPPDETPGASELGAVHFMDAALGGFLARLLPLVKRGVTNLDQLAAPSSFHQLGFDEQTAITRQIQDSAFFGQVHFMTLVGLFALPSYGGNKDGAAWKMIGFESRHVWQHPFGYYDAGYDEESAHAST